MPINRIIGKLAANSSHCLFLKIIPIDQTIPQRAKPQLMNKANGGMATMATINWFTAFRIFSETIGLNCLSQLGCIILGYFGW